MKTKEDEIARSHRIATELRELQRSKCEQDRHVEALMRGVSAWQLEHAEIPALLRRVFEAPLVASPPKSRRAQSITGALRG